MSSVVSQGGLEMIRGAGQSAQKSRSSATESQQELKGAERNPAK